MTYVVTETCIKCKYTDCIEVCPVSCFYEGENMVVINPEQCIDCGVCELECPIGAIIPDTVDGAERWVELNQKYAQLWPNITFAKAPFPEASHFKAIPHKLQDHFSPNPGKGG